MEPCRELASRVIRAVRGRRHASVVSRRLGMTYNRIQRCEDGESHLSWPEFVNLCMVCKRSDKLRNALARTTGFTLTDNQADPVAVLRRLLEPAGPDAAIPGISAVTLRRWLTARRTPDLEHILAVLGARQGRLEYFFCLLFSYDEIERSFPEAVTYARLNRLNEEHPLAVSALLALGFQEYSRMEAHEPGFIARKIGVTDQEEAELLRALEGAGAVAWENGKAVNRIPQEFWISFSFSEWDKFRRYMSFWLEKGLRHAQATQGPCDDEIFRHFVVEMSPELLLQAKVLVEDFRRSINRLAANPLGEPDRCFSILLYMRDLATPAP